MAFAAANRSVRSAFLPNAHLAALCQRFLPRQTYRRAFLSGDHELLCPAAAALLRLKSLPGSFSPCGRGNFHRGFDRRLIGSRKVHRNQDMPVSDDRLTCFEFYRYACLRNDLPRTTKCRFRIRKSDARRFQNLPVSVDRYSQVPSRTTAGRYKFAHLFRVWPCE